MEIIENITNIRPTIKNDGFVVIAGETEYFFYFDKSGTLLKYDGSCTNVSNLPTPIFPSGTKKTKEPKASQKHAAKSNKPSQKLAKKAEKAAKKPIKQPTKPPTK